MILPPELTRASGMKFSPMSSYGFRLLVRERLIPTMSYFHQTAKGLEEYQRSINLPQK
jgi:hypothetical protein